METAYREWEKQRQARERGRRTAPRRVKARNAAGLGVREKRRLTQLAVCILLFLAVFVGKGVFPDRVEEIRAQAAHVLESDTDFRAVFAGLGRSISAGEPVLDTLSGLWVDVFGGGTVTVPDTQAAPSRFYEAQLAFLSGGQTAPAAHWLEGRGAQEWPEQEVLIRPQPLPKVETEAEPAVLSVPYDGPPLPDNATMDRYSLRALGITETVTPALGWISSGFGWREHPVEGGEKFHNGVDLGVNLGTDVLAFASGTVEYIGESPIYGLYLQISHAGGLKSFYAHCDQLLVQAGQTVQAGQRIAQSGETGNATGPHLHFEMKLNGVLLNPAYYIETI